jgi:RNase P/RNase MRP subunit p30
MDIVYGQPLKELLQISAYFKEQIIVLISTEIQELQVKKKGLIPCYLVDEKFDLNKIKNKKKAVYGGSVVKNEFAVKIKADFLLQPSNEKQFFDLGLAKKLSENKTTVVLLFDELSGKNSFDRNLFWKNYLEIVYYCKQKGTKFFVASGGKEPLCLRPQKVRIALGELLGLSKEKAEEYLEKEK